MFRHHGKEIKAAIAQGITDRFDLLNGSRLLKASEILSMGVTEAERFRRLSQKQRKSEKDKDKESDKGKF